MEPHKVTWIGNKTKTRYFCWFQLFISVYPNTVEPRYNKLLGTMKIKLLYQVSHYTKGWDQQNYLVIRGFCYIRPLYNEVPLYNEKPVYTVDSHFNELLGPKKFAFYNETLLYQGYKNNTTHTFSINFCEFYAKFSKCEFKNQQKYLRYFVCTFWTCRSCVLAMCVDANG